MSACTASHYWQFFSSTYQVVTLRSFHNLFSCQPESWAHHQYARISRATCLFDMLLRPLDFRRVCSSLFSYSLFCMLPHCRNQNQSQHTIFVKKECDTKKFLINMKIWSSSMRTWFSHIKRNSHIILTPNKLPMPHTSCLNHFEAFNPKEKSHFVEILNMFLFLPFLMCSEICHTYELLSQNF